MPGPHAIAEAANTLPPDAVFLLWYAGFGGACGLARACNASAAVAPSMWVVVSMTIVGMALGGISGGLCMWKWGTADGAFFLCWAVSGLCGLSGPAVATKILTKIGATKGIAP